MSKYMTIGTQGVQGKEKKYSKTAYVEIDNMTEDFKIEVDCYQGAGTTYKERETAQITINFPNGSEVTFNSIKALYQALTGRTEY